VSDAGAHTSEDTYALTQGEGPLLHQRTYLAEGSRTAWGELKAGSLRGVLRDACNAMLWYGEHGAAARHAVANRGLVEQN
jgi:hypothetical protein